jgi:hypothetical protein
MNRAQRNAGRVRPGAQGTFVLKMGLQDPGARQGIIAHLIADPRQLYQLPAPLDCGRPHMTRIVPELRQIISGMTALPMASSVPHGCVGMANEAESKWQVLAPPDRKS